jgi:hypothetical protein
MINITGAHFRSESTDEQVKLELLVMSNHDRIMKKAFIKAYQIVFSDFI